MCLLSHTLIFLINLGLFDAIKFSLEKWALKLAHVLSVAALHFHSLVTASGRLCAFRTQLKDFSTTWAGACGYFTASVMSTVSSIAFVKVPKGSVTSNVLLEIFMLPLTKEVMLLQIFHRVNLAFIGWNFYWTLCVYRVAHQNIVL